VHGRLHHVVLDCPEPRVLADFYSALLGQPVTYDDGDFAVVAADATTSGLGFQRAPGHVPPTWPDPAVPQQVHLDVMVEDVDSAGSVVIALGGTRLGDAAVFADPSGHPFCLVRRPHWAAPHRDREPAPAGAGGLPSGPMSDPGPVADLLHEAAETHHRVYRITDGEDADWASWYADWLIRLSELPDLLGRTPVRSELVHRLVLLDEEFAAQQLAESWEQYYAGRLIRHFAAPED
jgi:catechol 2,3-dioxygenase-like lactoylglutathione lyase family enzyme